MTVDCSHVERKSWAIKQDDPRIVFYTHTRSTTNYKSGYILVLVSPEDAPAFANKYGFDMEIVSRRNIRTREFLAAKEIDTSSTTRPRKNSKTGSGG
jgi:hypothetical protein